MVEVPPGKMSGHLLKAEKQAKDEQLTVGVNMHQVPEDVSGVRQLSAQQKHLETPELI